MYVSEPNGAVNVLNLLAIFAPRVDFRLSVEQLFQLCCCVLGFTHVACKAEDGAGRLHAEDNFGEDNEELKEAILAVTNQCPAVPKAECNTQKHERLREGIKCRVL